MEEKEASAAERGIRRRYARVPPLRACPLRGIPGHGHGCKQTLHAAYTLTFLSPANSAVFVWVKPWSGNLPVQAAWRWWAAPPAAPAAPARPRDAPPRQVTAASQPTSQPHSPTGGNFHAVARSEHPTHYIFQYGIFPSESVLFQDYPRSAAEDASVLGEEFCVQPTHWCVVLWTLIGQAWRI